MPVSAALRRELFALPPEEREELAAELYESLVDENLDPEWKAAWSKEIAARIADADKNPDHVIDADEMMSELRAELSAKQR